MSGLTLECVSVSIGRTRILHDISLEVPKGSMCVLLGPSGSGKSTLLRAIVGLEEIETGSIALEGREISRLSSSARDVAMVFQSFGLYPRMTVEQNISFALKIRGIPKVEIQRKVSEIANLLDIGSILKRIPSQLSGGQQQRVAIGRALARDSAFLAFDEPLSNLDAGLRSKFRGEIKRIMEQAPRTSIYVTHDYMEALSLGDKVAVMVSGRIAQQGTPIDVYRHPANRQISAMMGDRPMNFVVGNLEASHGGTIFRSENGLLIFPDHRAPLDKYRGGPLILGFRPENGLIRPSDSSNGFLGTVSMVEEAGANTFITVRCAKDEICVRAENNFGFEKGSPVSVGPDGFGISFFSCATEERLG